jgi:hypothetical protein
MTFKNKFNLGDSVYVYYNNRAVLVTIKRIQYTIDQGGDYLSYFVDIVSPSNQCEWLKFRETQVFETEKELLESL